MSDGRLLVVGALAGLLLAGRVAGSRAEVRQGRRRAPTWKPLDDRPFVWRTFNTVTGLPKRGIEVSVLTNLDSRFDSSSFATQWGVALREAFKDAERGNRAGNNGVLLRTFAVQQSLQSAFGALRWQGGLILIPVPFMTPVTALVLTAPDLGSHVDDDPVAVLEAVGCLPGAPNGLVEDPIDVSYFRGVVDAVLNLAPVPPGSGSRSYVRQGRGSRPPSRYEILATTGDMNPFDHGGGVVFRDREGRGFGGPAAAPDPSISWWSWKGQDEAEDEGSRTYEVWQVNVPDDVLAEVTWVDDASLAAVAGYVGVDVKTLRRMSKSNDVRERVRLLEDIAGYYGMENFDSQPVDYTQNELIELFPSLK